MYREDKRWLCDDCFDGGEEKTGPGALIPGSWKCFNCGAICGKGSRSHPDHNNYPSAHNVCGNREQVKPERRGLNGGVVSPDNPFKDFKLRRFPIIESESIGESPVQAGFVDGEHKVTGHINNGQFIPLSVSEQFKGSKYPDLTFVINKMISSAIDKEREKALEEGFRIAANNYKIVNGASDTYVDWSHAENVLEKKLTGR